MMSLGLADRLVLTDGMDWTSMARFGLGRRS
jgi:hypothetical protein